MKLVWALVFSCVLLAGCEYIEMDKCLDRGGRWDYEKRICKFVDADEEFLML